MFTKKQKNQIVIFSLLLIQSTIFAISTSSSVNSIGQSNFVGEGIFPVSCDITYNVYDFDFIDNYPIKMTFDMNGGYTTRSLIQDPISGLDSWCEDEYISSEHGTYLDNANKYGAIFSEWEVKFSQLLPISEKLPGKLTTWISSSGHYEQAIDLLEIYQNKDPYLKPSIFNQLISDYDKTFVGVPDLSGNRYFENFSLNLGFIYTQTIFNDISLSFYLDNYYSPYWFFNNNSDDDSNYNYFKINPTLYLSKTIYNVDYNDLFNGSNFRLFGITISNATEYRYLSGDSIPRYMVDFSNLKHSISNTISIAFNGPQIIASDTYPYISFYYYSNYKWGKLNNCLYDEYKEGSFYQYVGSTLEFRLIGIIHFQYLFNYNITSKTIENKGNFYVQL